MVSLIYFFLKNYYRVSSVRERKREKMNKGKNDTAKGICQINNNKMNKGNNDTQMTL